MRLNKALEDKILDTRLRDKLLAENKLTKTELKSYLDGMVDETENSIYTHEVDAQASDSSVDEVENTEI
jgi:hypothetical protein